MRFIPAFNALMAACAVGLGVTLALQTETTPWVVGLNFGIALLILWRAWHPPRTRNSKNNTPPFFISRSRIQFGWRVFMVRCTKAPRSPMANGVLLNQKSKIVHLTLLFSAAHNPPALLRDIQAAVRGRGGLLGRRRTARPTWSLPVPTGARSGCHCRAQAPP